MESKNKSYLSTSEPKKKLKSHCVPNKNQPTKKNRAPAHLTLFKKRCEENNRL